MLPRFIRIKEVTAITGLHRASLYRYIARGMFPEPVRIGIQSVAWRENEVANWMNTRDNSRKLRRAATS